jgi:nucleoside-diphosphate-sugar epimerase
MNILITGIHGFVGSNLVSRLKPLHTIYGLDIISPHKDGVFKTFRWDELERITPVDAIIHLAGKAHDTKNTSSEKEYFDINVGLTKKIFEYFLNSDATKFIYFSSVKAIADSVKNGYLTEETEPNPGTAYGRSKLEAEKYIISRKSEAGSREVEISSGPSPDSGLQTSDKKVYILRPCMIHGPGNKGNLNLLYKMVKTGIPWPLGAFENQRSFLSIENLQFIVQGILEENMEPGIYHLADDEPVSTNRLIELIAESLRKKSKIYKINPSIINGLAKLGDIIHLPINSERLKKLTESYIVSNDKIKTALGLSELPVSAEEGLRRTLVSFRE